MIKADTGCLIIVNQPPFFADRLDKPDGSRIRVTKIPCRVHFCGSLHGNPTNSTLSITALNFLRIIRAFKRRLKGTFDLLIVGVGIHRRFEMFHLLFVYQT